MEIVLDGRDWRTEADLIEAVIAGVQGPPWHGRNFNALADSLITGSINRLEPPYDFIIRPPAQPTPEVADAIALFIDIITEGRSEGVVSSVRVVP